ncbi:MAG: methyltransferase MtaB domain-containing protein, partial [Candidatus Methanomethylophilaceae archaeon]
KELEGLPDDTDKFVEYCTKKYTDAVPNFNIKNYGL